MAYQIIYMLEGGSELNLNSWTQWSIISVVAIASDTKTGIRSAALLLQHVTCPEKHVGILSRNSCSLGEKVDDNVLAHSVKC